MISSNDARPGMLLEIDSNLFKVINFHHNKTGRGGAVIKLKLRNLQSGATTEETFRPGDKFKRVMLDTRSMQFLYADDDQFHFMDTDNFEQIIIEPAVLEEAIPYLKEEMVIDVQFYKDKPIGVDLPIMVELQVITTEPGLKGDTVSGSTKPAKCETGVEVQVPLFIEQGDILRVDTRTGTYLERA